MNADKRRFADGTGARNVLNPAPNRAEPVFIIGGERSWKVRCRAAAVRECAMGLPCTKVMNIAPWLFAGPAAGMGDGGITADG